MRIKTKTVRMIQQFQTYLEKSGLSANTVSAYVWAVKSYYTHYEMLNEKNLQEFRAWLIGHYKPQTVNLRLMGINRYLRFINKEKMQLRFVKVQQRIFLEEVISDADYRYFKERLKQDGHLKWYFIVWFMSATGARVSELLQIRVEHVEAGFLDIYSKGGKVRRLYIPRPLQQEALSWIRDEGSVHHRGGFLFQNRFGEVLSARGVALQLKRYALQYGLNPRVVHPHVFRHLYAKSFLQKSPDISLLADLMIMFQKVCPDR